jgi:hypothetical protein
MTLQQAAGYQNRKDIPPQQAAGNYQVKIIQPFNRDTDKDLVTCPMV